MPRIDERTFARARKLDPDRDVTAAAADFYLLETLANVKGDPWAAPRLATHESTLAEEFACYLDIAIGGELRHAKNYLHELPKELTPYFREVSDGERGKAWLTWTVIRRAFGLEALDLAEEVFDDPGWPRNFGGRAWGYVARALRAYLEGARIPRLFVDQCFNLEHNTGCILNKLYNVTRLPRVLSAHGKDDYATLLSAASPEVRERWKWHEWRIRIEHDPIWLGVQLLESFDHAA